MPTYLVTGGAGFIGSNLVAELLERGADVRVLDNFSTGRRANIGPFLAQIDLVEGDLRDLTAVHRAVEGIRYVLHLGALPSVPGSIADPLTAHAVNATGTVTLLIAARDAGVERLVLASSCAVYGDSPVLPKREEMLPAPRSPYAASKLAAEYACRAFADTFPLDTVSLRYFNVFGPRQDPASQYAAVIPSFVTAMLNDRPPTIYGDGQQSRDFVYVSDVVAASVLACTAPAAGGRVLNVASGRRHSLLDLLNALNDILGTRIAPDHAPQRAGEVRHSVADVSAASTALGYRPRVGFREGLRRTVAWYRDPGS